jgi:hypothetical protein
MWLIATLAGARTWRLLSIDDAGYLARKYRDKLAWAINPPEFRRYKEISPRRKDVSRWTWRRQTIARSLLEMWDCPWCMAFWLTAAWVATGLAWSDTWGWQLLAGSLAANYIVGMLRQLDPGEPNDDER